ncbi:MAG TPA: hypothetical protein VHF58_10090 [Solirubrobacterales bacterium]|nr:hypothetical protein [Solirubrobacterales bacterium]
MSQENVEIVRDDAIYHGKEGFFQATAEWTEDFEDWTVTAEEFLDAGEGVLVRVRQTARGRISGVPVDSVMWFDLRMHEGRVARLTFHNDRAKAFKAAGLSE